VIKLPQSVDINNLIDDLRIFSWEASEILLYYSKILRNVNSNSNILEKVDFSNPVTIADLKVNDLIIKRINEKYQNIDWEILSEENVKDKIDNSKNKSDWIWILDPLDGTKDFIQGTENYAMHLALCYKKRPYLGVVLIPEKDELWIADGREVWCESMDGSKKSMNISKKKTLKEMTVVTSKNHRNKNLKNLIEKVNFQNVLVMGSIGCKFASILRGESDIYISLSLPGKSSPKDWDFASPEAILKASGGVVTNLKNKKLFYGDPNYEKRGIIVASNNCKVHQEICSELEEIVKRYNIYPL
tara:strand:- start:645 stop:1547 length:903 start_codon:yes stop_codon:yes gene_type:complete